MKFNLHKSLHRFRQIRNAKYPCQVNKSKNGLGKKR